MPSQLTSTKTIVPGTILRTGLALGCLLSPAVGCGLIGVEPDEIDVLDGDTSGASEGPGGSDTGGSDGESATGDGDPSNGDGDGDPATGDGDGDATGDGDGDATGDGDGDGDTTGDGDGDDSPCDQLEVTAAVEGDNLVDIPDTIGLLTTECGADGPEQLFLYTAAAPATVDFVFTPDADVVASVYLLDLSCDPAAPLACVTTPDAAQLMMEQGQSVYVVVDSPAGALTGSLTISSN